MSLSKCLFLFAITGCLFSTRVLAQCSIQELDEYGTAPFEHVSIADDMAYCAAGPVGLVVLNVSNPAQPMLIAEMNTSFALETVFGADQNTLFLADRSGVLQVDVTDPMNPITAATVFTGLVEHLAFKDGFLYLGNETDATLTIMDVANPDQPIETAQLSLSGHVNQLLLQDNLLYAATSTDLTLFDLTDPSNPLMRSQFGDAPRSVAVHQDVVHISGNFDYAIWSTADPDNPQPITLRLYDLDHYGGPISLTQDGAISIMSRGPSGMNVFDVSKAPTLALLGSLPIGRPANMVVRGNLGYQAAHQRGLRIYDLGAFPFELIGSYQESARIRAVHHSADLTALAAYDSKCNYCATVRLLDVTNPADLQLNADISLTGRTTAVAIVDNFLYAAYEFLFFPFDRGLAIYDISNPQGPVFVQNVPAWSQTFAHAAGGIYSVVSNRLHYYDLSNPNAPQLLKTSYQPSIQQAYGSEEGLFVRSDTVYALMDLTDPTAPVSAGLINPGVVFEQIKAKGDYAFAADETSLFIIHIADPSQMQILAQLPLEGIKDLTLDPNQAMCYVSHNQQVSAVSIADPKNPVVVEEYSVSSSGKGLTVRDNVLILPQGEAGKVTTLQLPTNRLDPASWPAQDVIQLVVRVTRDCNPKTKQSTRDGRPE